MRNFKLKVVTSALFLGIAYCLFCGHSKAASATVSASSKNVSVGDKVTINVAIDAATWNVYVSGAVSDSIVGYNNDLANEKTTKSYTLDTSKAGTYTVSLSGTVKDGSGKSNASDSVIVTVAEKAATSTTNNNNSNSNNNTNKNTNNNNTNNNNSNNNKTTQEKEPTFKSVNETVYATGDVNVRKSYSTSSDKIGYLEGGKSVTRTGIGDNGWSKVTYNGATAYINSSFLTTEKPEEKKSADKALKSLEVTPEGLTPAFDPETTTYTLEVTASTEKIDVKATSNDEKAKVTVTGNDALKVGDNAVKITVTAEDETARIYTINVKRPEKSTLALSSLKINGCTMSPAFSPEVYEYNVDLKNSTLDKLDLSAIPGVEGAEVEITGNENLKNGANTVTITVKSEDGTEKSIYKIHVKKTAAAPVEVKTENKKSKLPFYIGFGAIALLIILMIIIIVKDRRDREYEEDDEDEYQDDNNDEIFGYAPRSEKKYGPETSKDTVKDDDLDYNPYTELKSEEPNKLADNSFDGLFGTIDNVDESLPQAKVNDNLTDAMKDYKIEEEKNNEMAKSYNAFFNNESETYLDSDVEYDYKPRKSKGKHSK